MTEQASNAIASPRLASTVLIVRDGATGPEIFMVRRHQESRFMANAMVFVGGRTDELDADPAFWSFESGVSVPEAAKRIGVAKFGPTRSIYAAAVRETFEESGVLLARDKHGVLVSAEGLAPLREALNTDEVSFGDLLAKRKLTAAFSELRYLAHWITPEFEPRRYDTYFFACRMPPGQQASYDERETTAGDWYRVDDVLEANKRADVLLAPPTLCVLEDLAGCKDADALLARASDTPTAPVMPRALTVNADVVTLLLPGDHRYDDQTSSSGREHYVALRDGRWQRART